MSDICNEWRKNPEKNPRTGRKIVKTGNVYKKLEKECGKASSPKASSPKASSPKGFSPEQRDLCIQFMDNPTVNPATGRAIQVGKSVYNKYMKMCEKMESKKEEEECFNEEDPITMESINDASQPIIKLGKGKRKHCFLVTSIYGAIASQQTDGIIPVNPISKEPITEAEISHIFKVRQEYVDLTQFQKIKERKTHKELIKTIRKDLVDNIRTDRIIEIKNLSPEEVVERYDNLIKKGHKTDALTLRIIWEFFNFSKTKMTFPLDKLEEEIANSIFNTIAYQIAHNNLSVAHAVRIGNITKLTRPELKKRVKVLRKIDKIEALLVLLIWNIYSVNAGQY
jgi:hypothetical protein